MGYNMIQILIILLMIFITYLYIKKREKEREINEIKEEMPFWIREIAMLLEGNIPFNIALKESIKHYKIRKWIKREIKDFEKESINKGLLRIAEKSDDEIKKIFLQIISAYEYGKGERALFSLAKDLINERKLKIKEETSKYAILNILFTINAVIAPILLIIISVAGKFSLGIELNKVDFILYMLIIIIADFILLFINQKNKMYFIFILGVLIGLTGFLQFPINYVLMLSLIFGYYFITKKIYEKEKKIEEIKESFPNMLFSISNLPKNYTLSKIIYEMYKNSQKALKEEIKKSINQLKAGINERNVLIDLKNRLKIKEIERALEIIDETYLSGANLSKKIHEIAEDLLMKKELDKEKENMVSIQKYTVMLGIILIPFILGVMLSVTKEINSFFKSSFSEEFLNNFIIMYISIYSSIVANYVTNIENKKSKELIYFTIALILGLFIFNISKLIM